MSRRTQEDIGGPSWDAMARIHLHLIGFWELVQVPFFSAFVATAERDVHRFRLGFRMKTSEGFSQLPSRRQLDHIQDFAFLRAIKNAA